MTGPETRSGESLQDRQEARGQRLPGVFARGIAMGAADIVPGVSGGTIAFITGIYFRLLAAVNAVPVAIFRHLLKGHVRAFWQACDGRFLLSLVAGILCSIVSLASVITLALKSQPVLVWSFFFGLILASVWHVGRQVRRLRPALLWPLLAGAGAAWWITSLPAGALAPSPLTFLAAGALAICAMILPGISGSFILVIIGMYAPVLAAIRDGELVLLALFMTGCVLGLLSVARLITWAFRHCHDLVLALLTGFMVGSLNKVWPWREVLSWRTNRAGESVPLQEANLWPSHYQAVTGLDPQVLPALALAILGLLTVLVIERLGERKVLPCAQNECSPR
tara:strand:- start:1733 stop:2743 length:1011 start_codon:yes stop_codon:yes gene_type:complete